MERDVRLLAEKVLKRKTNVFLEEIEYLMEGNGVGSLLASKETGGRNKTPGRSQFKSLMDAAGEAACVEELLLFLAYQESKKGGWDNQCKNRKSIAANLVDSLMKIQNQIYNDIEEEAKEINSEDERLLRLEIAKKYMGYLFWKASVISRH